MSLITLGVCAMAKKVKSLSKLLDLLSVGDEIECITFPEELILGAPVEEWPVVQVLISFHSAGFPLEKAQAYAALRQPFCVNKLEQQSAILLDRRHVYAQLKKLGVPTPHHAWHDHLDPKAQGALVQVEDGLEIGGVRINKPFVEKPVDSEDHRVHVYYHPADGGGSKRLFRKVGSQSSAFFPDENAIRTDGACAQRDPNPHSPAGTPQRTRRLSVGASLQVHLRGVPPHRGHRRQGVLGRTQLRVTPHGRTAAAAPHRIGARRVSSQVRGGAQVAHAGWARGARQGGQGGALPGGAHGRREGAGAAHRRLSRASKHACVAPLHRAHA
jgi:hypothetical protein